MNHAPQQKFDADYIAQLRELLNTAVERIGPEHRTPTTKATAETPEHTADDHSADAHHPLDAAVRGDKDRAS